MYYLLYNPMKFPFNPRKTQTVHLKLFEMPVTLKYGQCHQR